jgi:acyl-CoA dehydrogenase
MQTKEENRNEYAIARDEFASWQNEIQNNIYTHDPDFIHTIKFNLENEFNRIHNELDTFGNEVAMQLEALVKENNLFFNLPRLEQYSPLGERIDKIVHHPSYVAAGNIIYKTNLLGKMAHSGGLSECLAFLFLSSQAGEAGHNCPIACSAGIIRVLQKIPDFPEKSFYLEKLTSPAFTTNFTGAQFLTEIQGGSDVGLNATYAKRDENNIWRIYGEKWFCSNANANLIFITARFNPEIEGTKGLSLFLIPSEWKGKKNNYMIRRLKDKIGTRSMATAEIDFNGTYAIQVSALNDGFHLVMDNVLHLSRLFNSVCVLGMGRRAYHIARSYAKHRIAFSQEIYNYPLVKENLACIKAENGAMVAAIFATTKMQDLMDKNQSPDKNAKLLLRLLVNIQKYLTARLSVQHIHHALDVLAGNGTIETFSSLPRLLRDSIVCENWEGTHNVLRMQVLKDILKYKVDEIYISFMQAEIEKLKSHEEFTTEIKQALHKLTDDLISFRETPSAVKKRDMDLDSQLQTLQIRTLVDRMGFLFCALMLLREALQQLNKDQSSSKLDCFHYFCKLHIHKDDIVYDKNYLDLISAIVA